MRSQTIHLMQFFRYDHLPENLQAVSKQFCDLAQSMADTLPDSAEKTAGLRKLLEAKDCAVRALVAQPVTDGTVSGTIETDTGPMTPPALNQPPAP